MSDNIPFDIQTQIIEKLPIKSLLRFRSISKQWKSLIDSSKFINSYHIIQPQHNLFVQYLVGATENYVSISDDDTFPLHKFSLTLPNSFKDASEVSLSHGLLCYHKNRCDKHEMVVLWNPSARRCIGIVIPNVIYFPHGFTRIGFGVCPDTNDPKLVKINYLFKRNLVWDVEVFTLSTRVWKRVSNISPFQSYHLMYDCQVSIEGFIYWLGIDMNERIRSNMIIYFDLRSEEFGKVYLPDSLVHSRTLKLSKQNECLIVLEYYEEGEITVCGVWMMKDDGVTKDFTKMFTVKVPGKLVYDGVLGFRKNGEAIIEIRGQGIFEYDPSSGSINDIGIDEKYGSFFVSSYMETLLLLDESDSIIH